MEIVFDIEANGLEDASKIHCMAYQTPSGVAHTTSYDEMRRILAEATVLIGHNIILYDVPTLERLLKIKIKAELIDTLALAWALFPNRILYGLEAFGEEYGVKKPPIDDWENLSPEEYCHRCSEDVKINMRLWKDLKNKLLDLYDTKKEAMRYVRYLSFKMDCAREQAKSKWKLDVPRAQTNLDKLEAMQAEKLDQLIAVMPKIPVIKKQAKPKNCFKKDGTYSTFGAKWFYLLKEHGLPKDYDGTVNIIMDYKDANPNSSDQVKAWLYSMGWKPTTFKYVKDGDSERAIPQVRVDNDGEKELCPSVLRLIPDNPSVKLLQGLTVIQHRLSIFRGFLDNAKDGWLIAGIGGFTNTLRFKHRVLVNLPGVDKPWGEEIRGCLIAPEGQVLCGSDMTSLEDMCKRHYIYEYDPEYVEEMSKPGFDPHLDLAKFASEVTQDEIDDYMANGNAEIKAKRKNYKKTNYSATYGIGKDKLARDADLPVRQAKELLKSFWERNWAIKAVADACKVKNLGGELWLFNPVSRFWYSLRYEKDRFSTLNQSTGVFCFDSWIREVRSVRPQLTAQFHDEIILSLKKGAEDKCRDLLKLAIGKVNNKLKLNIKLDVDVQFGATYADIH